ncbi:MAG: hypothetical protein HYT07_04230, partial [Candidatus Levybacteria bacterium]|nr:hypothetical protein [Candidatus Levybacteria bacterium]
AYNTRQLLFGFSGGTLTPPNPGGFNIDSIECVLPPTSAPTPTPTRTPTPIPTSAGGSISPTSVQCRVTVDPSVRNLKVGAIGRITASVTSGLGSAGVARMRFGSYNTSVATVGVTSDPSSPYGTSVRGISPGNTAVWATAHLSDGRRCQSTRSTDIDIKILSSIPTLTPTITPVPCQLTSASWGTSTSTEGETVTLNVVGNSFCNGKQVNFAVREEDSIIEGIGDESVSVNPQQAVFVGNTASSTWVSEWQNDCNGGCLPPEYFFNATLLGDPSITVRSSDPLLNVNKRPIQTLSRVEIQPASLTTRVGSPPIGFSALAYDTNNQPIWSGASYQWGISSTNSIATLSRTSGDIVTFNPLNVGIGDLFVNATFKGETVMKSMKVTVESAPPYATPSYPTPHTPTPSTTPDTIPFSSSVFPSNSSYHGTIFTINAITETNQTIKINIKGPGVNFDVDLLDNGQFSDQYAFDGIYNWTFYSGEFPFGIYTFTHTINGKLLATNTVEVLDTLVSKCTDIGINGDSAVKIDLIVVPDHYGEAELEDFKQNVLPRHINYVFSKDPFSLNKDKFNIWFLESALDVDCSIYNSGNCADAIMRNVSKNCSIFDKILVISKTDGGWAYMGGPMAVSYDTSNYGMDVTLHELGHSIGALADEYDRATDFRQSSTGHLSPTNFANCDVLACPKWCSGASSLEEPLCNSFSSKEDCETKVYNGLGCRWISQANICDYQYDYFGNVNFGESCQIDTACYYGCGGRDGYRSSIDSVMRSSNFPEFNIVSKKQIQKEIDSYTK